MSTEVVLDCRWLEFWGAGTLTTLLLQGLAADPPPASWLLWGPPRLREVTWPGARIRVSNRDPRAWKGQRACLETPAGRVVVFLHQQRPLHTGAALVLIHDTIQLRHGGTRPERMLRAAFLRCAAARAMRVITISEYSRRCIHRDLAVPEERITVVTPPVDLARADRVVAARERAAIEEVALDVGRVAPHKNLGRLLAAFERSAFCAQGGRLVITGGRGGEVPALVSSLTPRQREFTSIRPWCEEHELEALMATARFVVQPSLEEGFGLPVVEAMASGVTVCVSDGGSLPEVTRSLVPTFPARSLEAMTVALDDAAVRGGNRRLEQRIAAAIRAETPTPAEFAREFRAVVDESLARC